MANSVVVAHPIQQTVCETPNSKVAFSVALHKVTEGPDCLLDVCILLAWGSSDGNPL